MAAKATVSARWSTESALARRLLATSSLVALMAAAATPTPVRAAACVANNTNVVITGCTNAGALPSLSFTNATSNGNIINSGTISPGGISLVNSTVFGAISDPGTITGGIVIDAQSLIEIGADGIVIQATSTFGGGISNGGVIEHVNVDGILVNGVSTFTGGITNSGLVVGHTDAILIEHVSTFTGGLSNSGTISGGPLGIAIEPAVSIFSGGILNSGTVNATRTAIQIISVSTFTGGLSNTGTISAVAAGIALSSISTFAGGISNGSAGVIKAGTSAIGIISVGTFLGNISNAGTISAAGSAIRIEGGSAFVGNINNAGTIAAALDDAINIQLPSGIFAGGILNTVGGVINAGQTGIVIRVGTFTGGIVNDGAITATNGDGIRVANSVSAGFAGGITNAGNIAANLTGILIGTLSSFAGGVSNSGTITANLDGLFVNTVSTFTGGIANAGTLSVHGTAVRVDTVTQFSGGIVNSSGGTIAGADIGVFVNAVSSTFAGGISNSGSISGGTKALLVQGVGDFAGDIVNSGSVSSPGGRGISVASVATFAGNISNAGSVTAVTGIRIGAGVGFSPGSAIVNSGTISGTVAAIDASAATSAVTIDQMGGLISGAIKLSPNADVLNISGGTIAGNIVGAGSSDTINFALGVGTFTYGSAFGFTDIAAATVSSGTVILDGTNQATNTTVNGGTLVVGDASNPGAILQTNAVTVNGGTLAGDGTVDPVATIVTINSGGTLAPGAPGSIGTLTIGGSLTINAGSFYDVSVNDTAASKTLVNSAPGTATINGGTVVVTAAYTTLGAHGGTTFAILTAANGRSGTFSGLTVNTGSFTGSFALSYDADDTFLNVGKGFELLPAPAGATVNEANVFNGINRGILAGDAVPAGFNQLLGLSGAAYLNALNQLDGENATGAERGAFDLMNNFLGLMLDPFVDGRGGNRNNGGALGFAADQQAQLPPDVALAYAGLLKAPPPATFAQRWTAWASGFGGSATANGDPVIGSTNVTTSTYGYAAGLDYHYSPDTVFGFSLAGGGTNWNLANALGSGRSNALLAGVYGVTHSGPWYLGGALAFANNWFTTDRTAFAGDQLTAGFRGQSYAARLEGGYRFVLPSPASGGGSGWGLIGVTPYAAIQTQDFHTPAYNETDLTGGGFGLSYNAMNGTDTRSELGSRFDDLTTLDAMPLLLRASLAWAHDWVSNPALNASFESLPGTGFTVFGAQIPHDSALTSAGAQLFFTPNWSLLAKFDGEFASGYQLYAGSGTLRYTW